MDLFTQLLVNGLVRGGDYVLIAVGLSLIFGVLKLVNFAHGSFFLLGATFAYLAQSQLGAPYGVAVGMAVLGSIVVAIVAERVVVRPLADAPEESVFLSTFGLSFVILYAVVLGLDSQGASIDGLRGAFRVGGISVEYQQVLILAVSAVVTAALLTLLRRTRIGHVVSAVAQDRDAAELMGVNVRLVFSGTFALSAALACLAGTLVVPLSVLNPFSGSTTLLTGFIIVIIAGVDQLAGVVVTSVLLGLLESFAAGYVSTMAESLAGFLLLIVVLVVKPQGLFKPGHGRRLLGAAR